MNMDNEVVILVGDDDDGHVKLIERNLRRASLKNRIHRFKDGQEILDFLLSRLEEKLEKQTPYLLLLDIRMPKVDGIEVLEQLKAHAELRKIPVIMLTTTDDPREVERCHLLGCSTYIVKPIDYERHAAVIRKLAEFLALVKVPLLVT